MDLLPAIGSAIQTLQGINCDRQLQLINVLVMSPILLQFRPSTTRELFLGFYQTHHSLDAIPNHPPQSQIPYCRGMNVGTTIPHGITPKS